MSENKKEEGIWGRLITEIVGIIPKDMQELIGTIVGLYLFVLAPMILFNGGMALMKMFSEKKEQPTACWGIQEAAGRAFKINKCTGEAIEVSSAIKKEASQKPQSAATNDLTTRSRPTPSARP